MTGNRAIHLGDGAYAELNDFSEVAIYTSDGISRTNEVILDDLAAERLVHCGKVKDHHYYSNPDNEPKPACYDERGSTSWKPAAPKPQSDQCAYCDGDTKCIKCGKTLEAQPAIPPEPPQIPGARRPMCPECHKVGISHCAHPEECGEVYWPSHMYRKLESALAAERARREKLETALRSISRMTAPGTRTLDDFMRDVGYANDSARAALAQTAQEGKI